MKISGKKSRRVIGIALLPILTLSLQANTQHDTAVYVNEFTSGVSSPLDSDTSSSGLHISGSASGFSSEAFVDQAVSTTAPTLRVKADGSTSSAYSDPNKSKQSVAIAQTTTIFTATSGIQPFETSFNAGFTFNIDGIITYDVATPAGTEFSPFRPGDQGHVSFSLLIRPESDEYASAASTISISSEIYWDDGGIAYGDMDIYDGDFNSIGTAAVNTNALSATEQSFTVTASTPFSALVGVEYRMEAYFQATATLRGGTGDKAVEVDFFNSMNASPVADDGDFGFTIVPEPSTLGLLMLGLGALTASRRRRE